MQDLRALQLVTSTSGPKGGYQPTVKAYYALENRQDEDPADVPITSDGESIEEVRIRDLSLIDVHHPHECRGELSFEGSITGFELGATASIGPMPGSNLRVDGVVKQRDPSAGMVVLEIEAMQTLTDDHNTIGG